MKGALYRLGIISYHPNPAQFAQIPRPSPLSISWVIYITFRKRKCSCESQIQSKFYYNSKTRLKTQMRSFIVVSGCPGLDHSHIVTGATKMCSKISLASMTKMSLRSSNLLFDETWCNLTGSHMISSPAERSSQWEQRQGPSSSYKVFYYWGSTPKLFCWTDLRDFKFTKEKQFSNSKIVGKWFNCYFFQHERVQQNLQSNRFLQKRVIFAELAFFSTVKFSIPWEVTISCQWDKKSQS